MKSLALIGLACGALLSFGCSAASDETSTTSEPSATVDQSLSSGARCTVRGGITTGCAEGETCKLQACTNSIPPTCFGICQAPAPTKKCTGAFNCLCGTPVCIDGEWECQGNCGGDPALE